MKSLMLFSSDAVAGFQVGEAEVRLGRKVMVKGGLGDPRFVDDLVDARGAIALVGKQVGGGFQDAFAGCPGFFGCVHILSVGNTDRSVY